MSVCSELQALTKTTQIIGAQLQRVNTKLPHILVCIEVKQFSNSVPKLSADFLTWVQFGCVSLILLLYSNSQNVNQVQLKVSAVGGPSSSVHKYLYQKI